jgi:uncharacterized protein with NRDE domain
MCTVIFIPGKNQNYFASLRDESPKRQRSALPALVHLKGRVYMAPIDPVGGGTWIGANDIGTVIILLNGGFENHFRKEKYARSRGLILVDLLAAEHPLIDWDALNLNEIEPFTLIVWTGEELFRLVWDGIEKHLFKLSSKRAHIWSSATLYDENAKNIREALFQNWISQNPIISKLSLANFFKTHKDPVNGFFINRSDKMKTLSYSFLEVTPFGNAEFSYYDLLDNSCSNSRISFDVCMDQTHC